MSGSSRRARPAAIRPFVVIPNDPSPPARKPDFADAFAGRLTCPIADLRKTVEDALGAPPVWFRVLIGLRDRIVAPFGIETTAALRASVGATDRIDFFPVLRADLDEIVLGARDRHLDFTVSFRLVPTPRCDLLVATTRVWFRNWFGRLYLVVIGPFHRMVVRAMLRRMLGGAGAIRP